MKINSLKLQNFRSYKKFEFDFDKNTIIVGPNAKGKTNLLEAIYLTSVGKSFRAKEPEMINWGEDFFRIELEAKNSRPQKIEYIYEKNVGSGRKTIKINGAKKASSALLETLRCVFFAPDEIDMFFNFPALRRRHFNILISQTDKQYARELVKYSKVLEHRNALLKKVSEGWARQDELEVWDGKLVEYGAKIIDQRQRAVTSLNEYLSENYGRISSSSDKLYLNYESSIGDLSGNDEEVWALFLEALVKSRKRDLLTRVTNVGPHRDNFIFSLNERTLDSFGSRGEFRTVTLALKLSEVSLLKEKTKEMPVLLLDDVFSELDETRRRYLAGTFGGQQTIVTTTDLDHIDPTLRKTAQIFEIKDGRLSALRK